MQVNLRGRERDGRVSRGDDHSGVVDELVALVAGLSNLDGRSAIRKIVRSDDPRSRGPDVIVHWEHTATYPPGSLADAPHYEMLFSNHTGHHLPLGFCISHGDIAHDLEDEVACEDLHRPIVAAATRIGARQSS